MRGVAAQRGPSAKKRNPPPLLTSLYQAGVVHVQHSLDSWGNATAVAAGKASVAAASDAECQHIMGFGVLTPSVDSSHRDYVTSGLTDRVNTVMSGAGRKVITFATAPAWMRETPAGVTPIDDFSPQAWFEAPVHSTHVTDFANLCADIASTYTDVVYFQVWNELKGMFRDDLGRWDYARYTTLYNAVWTAVKAARPDAMIGGPYIGLTLNQGPGSPVQQPNWGYVDQRVLDVVTYWLANKTGADFITIDGGNNTTTAVEFGTFKTFMAWLRALNNGTYPGATTLPVWIAEHYCFPPGLSATPNGTDAPRYPAEWAVGTIEAILAGYSTCFLWGPQGTDSDATYGLGEPLGLVTDTNMVGGGLATTLQPVMKALRDNYSAGTATYRPATGNANLIAVGSTKAATLVNRAGTSQSTSGFSPAQTLTAYEVKTITWSPVGYTAATDASLGPRWVDDFTAITKLTARRGSVTAVSGKLRGGSTGADHMAASTAEYDTTDHYAEVVISTLSASSYGGVCLRYASGTNSYYIVGLISTGTIEVYYFNGSTYTLVTSASVTVGTLPGTLRGEIQGTTLRAYWRGVLAITSTGRTELTTGQPTTYQFPVGAVANSELDSWEADLL